MRHPNHRLVKTHRSYTAEEIAARLGVHRHTVREWIRRGLPTCDDRRPTLVLGRDLVAFLRARRLRNRSPCGPAELYCVRCRVPRRPAADMADYLPRTPTVGDLMGICPHCEASMYRRVSWAKLTHVAAGLDVRLPKGCERISESTGPSVNSAFRPRCEP